MREGIDFVRRSNGGVALSLFLRLNDKEDEFLCVVVNDASAESVSAGLRALADQLEARK